MITIRTIRTPDWPAIMAIQHECYHQFEPEPLEVMQNKTELAPASCWVAERQGKVLGYLLCHPWRAHQPPPLSVPMKALAGHDEFYLHDLAVSSKARGLGVGQRLLARALAFASHAGYRHAGLVAVQDAPAFWRKQGFVPADTGKSLVEYGDGAVYMRLPLADSGPEPGTISRVQ
ncbi:GNAT family N-acetyltransferase [Aeromonas caviae]|uniref:GNAT family N-acetyltransferase n=2 Tax=Aeromonadaceae TaxID=84642 RepID=UPI0005A91557|nr:GNAT family N-acetyltransferase [Aeromonas caviae]ATP90461.1 N-acetyltransferase [Aeromonas caviae]MBL0528949.1 GNAT family N-acetyltransferase [Aeromonas caviae]MBL0655825.1 GNAT family N-acetyltransferase [Aeromonas caviae]MBS4638085.1 GNAT family N-acetyltransferase [Aeromonas caviae]MDH0307588.1 GNAT family N-acetyltransferase [Aeromonas caviae]